MHLELEDLERYLDGELPSERIPTVEAHLSSCAACRALESTLRREESEVAALLTTLDDAPATRSEKPTLLPLRLSRVGPPAHSRRLQWAAAIAAIALAGMTYAMTWTPVGTWVRERLAHRPTSNRVHAVAPPAPEPRVAADSLDLPMAGVAVEPGASFAIEFAARREGQEVRVEWSDGRHIAVRGPSGISHFSSSPERLSIQNDAGRARFEIAIPRTAREVQVSVTGTTLLTARDGVITSLTSANDEGAYLLPLDR